ncbi:uncharacterized protein LOC142145009 [Mixophyes fleayi]|uniref:uncharacterized protein LOC142145009 n=1 Tax=Mixophyes fleayi TaxID=3061075 RepID=UPI003F4E0126
MSSLESCESMDCSETYKDHTEAEEEQTLSNTQEMQSASSSLESNMDLSEQLEESNENQNSTDDTGINQSNNIETISSCSVKVLTKTRHGGQEQTIDNDNGSQEIIVQSSMEVRRERGDGSQIIDNNNGSQEIIVQSSYSVKLRRESSDGSQEQSIGENDGSQDVLFNIRDNTIRAASKHSWKTPKRGSENIDDPEPRPGKKMKGGPPRNPLSDLNTER